MITMLTALQVAIPPSLFFPTIQQERHTIRSNLNAIVPKMAQRTSGHNRLMILPNWGTPMHRDSVSTHHKVWYVGKTPAIPLSPSSGPRTMAGGLLVFTGLFELAMITQFRWCNVQSSSDLPISVGGSFGLFLPPAYVQCRVMFLLLSGPFLRSEFVTSGAAGVDPW